MARRHLLTPVVMTIVLVTMAAFASVAAASGLRIVAPANERFLTSAPVHLKVEGPRSVRKVHLTLDGKGISGRLHRVKPGVWRGTLGRKQVRVGADQLDATAQVKGRQAHTRSFFTLGKRDRKLLTVAAPRPGANAIAAQARVAGRPEKLSARLNGKRLRLPLGEALTRRNLLRLGADDGLHYGVNHLKVMAIRGGTYDLERRKITVPRTGPLVGAGPDRRTVAGRKVRLDGSSSRAADGSAAGLSYQWKIIRKPIGSKATLTGAEQVRPVLSTDLPGTYKVALTVTEPGNPSSSATDVFTDPAPPNLEPLGMPFETMVYNGQSGNKEDVGIKLGSQTQWMGNPEGNNIQVMFIYRNTLEAGWYTGYAGTAQNAAEFKEDIEGFENQAYIVVSVPDGHQDTINSAWYPLVESLGISKQAGEVIRSQKGGWSVIGVPGVKNSGYFAEGGWRQVPSAGENVGRIRGYLEEGLGKESEGKFGFVPSEREAFETSASGSGSRANTIKIGSKEYKSQALTASCGSGGFQVQEVMAETLVPVSSATFTTQGCGAAADRNELGKLASWLSGVTLSGEGTEGPKLVFMQGIGNPWDPEAQQQWNDVAVQVARLGGVGQVFSEAEAGYAFVGGIGISRLPLSEASTSLNHKESQIDGVLEPGREGSFVPMLSAATSGVPYELSTIAYQQPQAWPDSESAEDKAALTYAWEVMGLEKPVLGKACSVPKESEEWLYLRAEYCNLRYAGEWVNEAKKLEKPAPAGKGFNAATWTAVTEELRSEAPEVNAVWSYVSRMQAVFGISANSADINLEEIGLQIEKDLRPPGHSEVAGWWLELAANMLSFASPWAPVDTVEKIGGSLSGALFIAAQAIWGPQGAPEAEEFNIVTKQFAKKLAERYLAASIGLGFIGELLVTDYGKLTAISKSGVFSYDPREIGKLEESLGPGSRAWSYEQLMPAAYEAISLEATPNTPNVPLPQNASSYQCSENADGFEESYKPFKASTYASLRASGPSEALGVLVVKGSKLPDSDDSSSVHPQSPKAELLEPIFGTGTGDLGLHPQWFWRTAFDYPTSATKSMGDCN